MMARIILDFALIFVVVAAVVITAMVIITIVVSAVLKERDLEEAEQKEKDFECFHWRALEGFWRRFLVRNLKMNYKLK